MVEQVGSRSLAAAERAELRAVAPAAVKPAVAQPKQDAVPAPENTAKQLAASAPVDLERVARIRRAVEEGRFPISPATIADRLIALQFEWNKAGTAEGQAYDAQTDG